VESLDNELIFDYSADGIRRSYDESLTRLNLERVEILLLHDIDRRNHSTNHRALVKQVLDEALPSLARLKDEGRVDAIGIGVCTWEIGFELLASADIDCVLLAGRYTLLDQSAFTSGFLDTCARRHISVLNAGVFNSGILAGGNHYEYEIASPALIQRRDLLSSICERYQVPLPAAALRFSMMNPAIASVSVGARSAREIEQIAQWASLRVPQDLWEELRAAKAFPKDISVND